MKYCPDCDMEFYDEVEVCTDCGKPLIDKDEYLKGKAEQEAEMQRRMEQEAARMKELSELEKDTVDSARTAERPPRPSSGVYVTRSEKYDDLNSSASAFRVVGAILAVLALLSWGSAFHLPISIPSNPMFRLLVTLMAVGAILISLKTSAEAKTVKGQIREEEQTTESLISWFLETYTPEQVDEAVRRENGNDLMEEEFALKRMIYIQDTFITTFDLADQGYVDALSEEVYAKLYE